jgi:phosphoribosylamine--glycine ligase
MDLLLIGSGGREHALAWKLAQSSRVDKIYVAPGNGGTATQARAQNVPIAADDLPALRDFAQAEGIGLTIVGPEIPLVGGIVDLFEDAGLRIFGPSKAAAELEGSKAFSKRFMETHGIPTGRAGTFTDFDEAMRYLRQLDDVPVIKASGLAAGKGVILPETTSGAAAIVREMLLNKRFGQASETVLIEERMQGPEVSVLAFTDGNDFLLMPAAQDHKRLLDGDRGPNTGGMGAFAPSPRATPALLEQVASNVIAPTLAGMRSEGIPFIGILYAGIMLTQDGPKVLEFNCRFGDPETQVILPLLDSDLLDLFEACIDGRLAEVTPTWREEHAVTVVMAARGYPGDYAKGHEIAGLEDARRNGVLVFHAGTKLVDERLVTSGGRVLNVTGQGATLADAAHQAYAGVRFISFNGAQYRRDIAKS